MSTFLVYFEKNNPDANWASFVKPRNSIEETFYSVHNPDSYFQIHTTEITMAGKVLEAFLIHDIVSSDSVLSSRIKEPYAKHQQAELFKFFKTRQEIKAVLCYFIFHIYRGDLISERITPDRTEDIRISNISDIGINLEREVLYKLIE